MTRPLAVQPCNAAGKLQAVYLPRCKQNRAQLVRPCLGLLDDPLTTQPCRKVEALFPMQSMQPLSGKARLFVMPSSENEPRKLVLRGPVCYAVNLSRAAQRQPSPTRNHAGQPIPHAVKTAPVEGRATRQCSVAQYGTTQPRPQRIHAARTNSRQPSACSTRQAMQIRPESRCKGLADSPYIHYAQRIARAVRGHFKRFSSFPVNARQCSTRHLRPPARS